MRYLQIWLLLRARSVLHLSSRTRSPATPWITVKTITFLVFHNFPRYGLKFIMNYKYFPIQNFEKEGNFSDKSFGGWDIFVHDPDEDW